MATVKENIINALTWFKAKILTSTLSTSITNAAPTSAAVTTALNGKAPTSHATTATTYGIGTASNYGHVKLSDTYASSVASGAAANGLAASQNALYNAYNTLNSKLGHNGSFSGTRNSQLTSGACYGKYDSASNMVLIFTTFVSDSNIQSSSVLYTVPSQYKPSSSRYGIALLYSNDSGAIAGDLIINSSGNIMQSVTNMRNIGIGMIQYELN